MAGTDRGTTSSEVDRDEKGHDARWVERVENSSDHEEVEPKFHYRTWIALLAFFLLNFVQIVAIQSPTAVVRLPTGTMQ